MTTEKKRSPPKALTRGITAVGRSKSYHRRGLWAIKKKHGGQFPTHSKKEQKEAAPTKAPRFYPADDVKKPLRRRQTQKPTALRASISPGTVLIIVAGRFKGKRVVFLKQLPSGLLLVTGPFSINGVPLRRVNQAYVIATSLKLDVAGADVGKIGDDYFKAPPKARGKKSGDGFFESEEPKKGLPAEYVENQKAVDSALVKGLDEDVKGYLAARFTLKAGDKPHLLKF